MRRQARASPVWRVARVAVVVILAGFLALVVVLFAIALLLNLTGERVPPLLFVAGELNWIVKGGPYQREFAGFEYEYETSDKQEIVRYQIRLSVHEPEHPKTSVFEYRKERFRSQQRRDERKADFVTWGTAELSDPEVQPVAKAVRAWRGAPKRAPVRGGGSAYPRLVFRATTRVSGWAGAFGHWSVESYEVTGAGAEVSAAAVDLLTSVGQAMPPRVRSRYSLPVPPRARPGPR